MSSNIRVRFAPSPTGMLHIGGLRTALYNWLFARHYNGTFILRIEDTDRARYVEGAEDDIISSLKWAGLTIDEGPGFGGSDGPYRQSERTELYKKYAQQLIESGHAYYAFDTQQELEEMRERMKSDENPNPTYNAVTRSKMKNSLTLPEPETRSLLESGAEYVIRLKVMPGDSVQFTDKIRGNVSFSSDGLDDQVLIKSDGLPTYHLANVVDDHHMKISHVIRGEEWLSSAPKHILMYKYLGWDAPEMAHLPLIMSPSGGKLSKRKAEQQGIPINVRDYISGHYEPQALVNFLAFLGWSPGDEREIMSLEELSKEFMLDRVSKAGAIFNMQKLTWYNEHYLRDRNPESLLVDFKIILEQQGAEIPDDNFLSGMIELLTERVSVLPEFAEAGSYFFNRPEEYEEKPLKKAWKEQTPRLIENYLAKISELSDDDFTPENLKALLTEIIEAEGVGFGKLMLPLRLTVTGAGSGPDLFKTMSLLGKKETATRIQLALDRLT